MLHDEFDFVHDGGPDGGHIDAVLAGDVQLDAHAALLRRDLDAAGHVFHAHQLQKTVGHIARDDALDAETVNGRISANGGKHVVGDDDVAFAVFHFHGDIPFFPAPEGG